MQPALGQEQPKSQDEKTQEAEEIRLTREVINNERQALVTRAMDLTPGEMQRFWPLYREYRLAAAKVGDRIVTLITTYADNHQNLTDKVANKLLTEFVRIEEDRARLKAQYLPKFKKVLPGEEGGALLPDREQTGYGPPGRASGGHPTGPVTAAGEAEMDKGGAEHSAPMDNEGGRDMLQRGSVIAVHVALTLCLVASQVRRRSLPTPSRGRVSSNSSRISTRVISGPKDKRAPARHRRRHRRPSKAGQYAVRDAARPPGLLAEPLPAMPGRAQPSEPRWGEPQARRDKPAGISRPSSRPRRRAAPTIGLTPAAWQGVGTR